MQTFLNSDSVTTQYKIGYNLFKQILSFKITLLKIRIKFNNSINKNRRLILSSVSINRSKSAFVTLSDCC